MDELGLDEQYLNMVLESQKQQIEPYEEISVKLGKKRLTDSEDDTDKFMKAFVANQSTCEILGKADQQLIYGNVGLKGTPPRVAESEEDKVTRATTSTATK